MSTNTVWTESALRVQLEDYEYDPAEFDLPPMLSRLNQDNDVDWFNLIRDHHVARQTATPCPEYCDGKQGHLFLTADEPGEPQSREHTLEMAPAGVTAREDYVGTVSITLTVPELRDGTDDTTARQGEPSVWLSIEGSYSPADVWKLAAALLAAGDKAQEISQ